MNGKQAKATIETYEHVKLVREHINSVITELIERAQHHDDSKFESPEVEIFGDHTEQLAKVEYGTPEYEECKALVQPAIDHHYAKNRHHPEHWPNGIKDMTLIDLVEMLCDWKAATQRNKNGNIRVSLDKNAAKYNMSDELKMIMENTVRELFDV